MQCSREQTLTELGRSIARQVGDGITEVKLSHYKEFVHILADKNRRSRTISDGLKLFFQSLANKMSQKRRKPLWVFITTMAAVTLGIFFSTVLPRYKKISFTVEPTTKRIGESVIAAGSAVSLEFENGSRFDLRRGGSATVESADEREVDIRLENGVLVAQVNGNGTTEWSVRAGPYRVVVLGTKFGVSWNEKTEVFDVKVEKGTVRVEETRLNNEEILISNGDHLRVDADNKVSINPDPNKRNLLASFPEIVIEKRPSPAPKSTEPAREPEIAIRKVKEDAHKSPGPLSGIHTSPKKRRRGNTERVAEPFESSAKQTGLSLVFDDKPQLSAEEDESGPETISIVPRLIQLIEQGRYAQARQEASKMNSVPFARSDLEDLWSLKDIARTAGLHSIAERALLIIRERFGRTKQARLAAYYIGKIYEENIENTNEAIRWYSAYLTESPLGNMAEQALSGKMRCLAKLKKVREAKHEAKLYLYLYNDGPYEREARAVLKDK